MREDTLGKLQLDIQEARYLTIQLVRDCAGTVFREDLPQPGHPLFMKLPEFICGRCSDRFPFVIYLDRFGKKIFRIIIILSDGKIPRQPLSGFRRIGQPEKERFITTLRVESVNLFFHACTLLSVSCTTPAVPPQVADGPGPEYGSSLLQYRPHAPPRD